MPTLTATSAGFHTLDPLGREMAPYAFLRSITNIEGTIQQDPESGIWQTLESLRHPTHAIQLSVDFLNAAPEEDGFRTPVRVTEITYTRTDATGTHVIGTLDLGAGITLSAAHRSNWQNEAGQWQADLADHLEDLIQSEGFRFVGGSGNDILTSFTPILPIYGRVEMYGRDGDDHLTGTLADDALFGGRGDDTLTDLSGHNVLRGGAGDDTIILGLWSDESRAFGGRGNDTLTSSNGSDRLAGGHGHDRIEGGRGADILIGNRGHDVLSGGEGRDRLIAGPGNDQLTGGDDADVFIFRADHQGWNRITDFEAGEDRLRFIGLEQDTLSFHTHEDGTFIHWGEQGAGLLLEGVEIADLGAGDFLF